MSIDTKALIAATPATVALVRRELDKSREAQRGGMQCSIPKAVKVDCAMVERLCRIAEKQAARLAALEAENQQLKAAWGELSNAVLATQDRLYRSGPDWTNVAGEFVWVSVIKEYAGIIAQHQEALAAGGGNTTTAPFATV